MADVKLNRVNDAVLNGQTYLQSGNASEYRPMINTKYGGQWGFATEIGHFNGTENKAAWISSQAYVPRDIIPILLQYPKFMDYMPNSELWVQTFKAFIERHAETIDGLDSELTVESEGNNLGASGSTIMGEPVATRIAKSSPTFTVTEKVGRPFGRMFEEYIRFGILDPWTQVVLIGSVSEEARDTFRKNAYLADYYTFTAIYIEPDVTMSHVVDYWLHLGGYPTTAGERKGSSNKGSAKTIRKLTIPMEGFCISVDAGFEYAQSILDELGIRNRPPLHILPLSNKDAALDDDDNTYGFNRDAGKG